MKVTVKNVALSFSQVGHPAVYSTSSITRTARNEIPDSVNIRIIEDAMPICIGKSREWSVKNLFYGVLRTSTNFIINNLSKMGCSEVRIDSFFFWKVSRFSSAIPHKFISSSYESLP